MALPASMQETVKLTFENPEQGGAPFKYSAQAPLDVLDALPEPAKSAPVRASKASRKLPAAAKTAAEVTVEYAPPPEVGLAAASEVKIQKKLKVGHTAVLKGSRPKPVVTDPNCFAGLQFVISGLSGRLPSLERKEAQQLIKECGGVTKQSVTKATDFLILGFDRTGCKPLSDSPSSKLAAELGVVIIDEPELFRKAASAASPPTTVPGKKRKKYTVAHNISSPFSLLNSSTDRSNLISADHEKATPEGEQAKGPKKRKLAELFCVCQKSIKATSKAFMIDCDKCKDKLHPKCIGMTVKACRDMDQFICPDCKESCSPQ